MRHPDSTSGSERPIDAKRATRDIDFLFRRALRGKGGQGLAELIQFMRRFRRHSLWNAALIRIQRPGAAAVATAHQWSNLGRTVNPDAIPIVVLQPFGPVSLVYELSDTSPPLKEFEGFNPFPAEGEISIGLWKQTVSEAGRKDQILVELVAFGTLRAGTAAKLMTNQGGEAERDREEGRYRVRIARSLTLAQCYTTLAHELAHIYCGHLGSYKNDSWPNRQGHLTGSQEELEAEAAAFIIAGRAGIDLASDKYLAEHVNEGDLDAISIDRVIRAASRIENLGDQGRTGSQRYTATDEKTIL